MVTIKFRKFSALFAVIILLSSVFGAAMGGSSELNVEAKDASHVGMTYLQVLADSGNNQISGTVNTEGQFNSWGGSDVAESTEYKKEQITWGSKNWQHIKNVLSSKGTIPNVPDSLGSDGALLNNKDKGQKFKEATSSLNTDGKDEPYAVSLTMSFPGWGAGDRVPDVTSNGNVAKSSINRNGDRNGDNATFASIDSQAASNAAAAVNNKLIGGLNAALEYMVSRTRNQSGQKATLSREGLINAVWLLANGYMPREGKTITYNEKTSTFENVSESMVKGKAVIANKPWNHDKAGDVVAEIQAPEDAKSGSGLDRTTAGDNTKYAYAVVKGYAPGVGTRGSDHYGTDAYAISWYDIAMALSAQVAYDTIKDESKASSTVVGDQVNNFMYSLVSGILSIFNIQSVDKVVFGDGGNLLKSGVFAILMVVQGPFITAAILILALVVLDAYRKTNMQYLSTGEQRSIMSSVGRVTNALIMIALTPFLVGLLIYLDQEIVKLAIGLNAVFLGFNYGTTWETQMSNLGLLGTAIDNVVGLGVGAILSLVMAGIDVKFTWRYIARAVSFGLYFCMAPVIFALDSLKGNGRLFEYGPTTGNIWKNLIGVILQRGMDALGIVFSLQLSKLLFGGGMIIKIMSLLSGEAISNTVMGLVGVSDTSVKGIAQTGRDVFGKAKTAAMAAGSVVGGVALAKAGAAVMSGRNRDKEAILSQLTGSAPSSVTNTAGSFGKEVTKKSIEKLSANKPTPNTQSPTSTESNTGGGTLSVANTDGAVNNQPAEVSVVGAKGNFDQEELVTTVDSTGAPVSGTAQIISNGLETPHSSSDKSSPTLSNTDSGSGTLINTGEGKPSLWNRFSDNFVQGFTNDGVHGDRNTEKAGGRGMRENRYDIDARNYEIDANGKVRAKNLKGSMGQLGRDASRALGALANPFGSGIFDKSKSKGERAVGALGGIGKTAAAAAFAASSTVTKTRLDNYAATAIAGNLMEKVVTGGVGESSISRFSKSFLGRSIGLTPGAFTFDEISADGSSYKSAMGGQAPSVAGQGRMPDGYDLATRDNNNGTITSRTSWSGDTKNKADKLAHTSANILSRGTGVDFTRGGVMTMSREQVMNAMDNNKYGAFDSEAAQLFDYMNTNGYDTVRYSTGDDKVAFDRNLQRSETVQLSDAQPGSEELWYKNQLAQSGGTMVAGQGRMITTVGDDGNAHIYQDMTTDRQMVARQYEGYMKKAREAGDATAIKKAYKEQAEVVQNPQLLGELYKGGIPTYTNPKLVNKSTSTLSNKDNEPSPVINTNTNTQPTPKWGDVKQSQTRRSGQSSVKGRSLKRRPPSVVKHP